MSSGGDCVSRMAFLFETLISLMFLLVLNSVGGYFKNILTGVCGPNLEDIPHSYKGQA